MLTYGLVHPHHGTAGFSFRRNGTGRNGRATRPQSKSFAPSNRAARGMLTMATPPHRVRAPDLQASAVLQGCRPSALTRRGVAEPKMSTTAPDALAEVHPEVPECGCVL